MAQDVVNLLFAGDSLDLLPRYADGVRQYRETGGAPPEHLVIAHSDEGLHVTLVWPEGVDHEGLGRFLLGRLGELDLPRPRVNHGTLATTSWNALAAQ
jgi:hypothetical protein